MSYGVDEDGRFNKKDLVDIREDMRQTVQNELSEDVSLQQNSPVQQLIDAFAVEISRQWDAAEDSYFSSFFEDAEGEQLDKQLALAGFSRRPLRPAEGVVVFSRETPAPRDIDIPEGTVVEVPATQTRPNIPFETTESFRLFESDSVTDEIPIQSLAPWQVSGGLSDDQIGLASNVEAGEITEIVDNVSGIDSVTNPVRTGSNGRPEFQHGRDRETDAEFKLRYKNTSEAPGVSTAPAIQSNVFQFDENIISVRVTEVRDGDLQDFGVEVTVLADGVSDNTLAQAVFESRAGGVESFGSQTGTAEFEDGRTVTERFERAARVDVYVDAELTVADTYPSDGDERIQDNIIRFVGGTATDDVQYPGLEIGDDVVYDQVKQRVMQVRGVRSANVTIGTDPTALGTDDILIDNLEAPRTTIADINITVV